MRLLKFVFGVLGFDCAIWVVVGFDDWYFFVVFVLVGGFCGFVLGGFGLFCECLLFGVCGCFNGGWVGWFGWVLSFVLVVLVGFVGFGFGVVF